jgi:predicted secreted protein
MGVVLGKNVFIYSGQSGTTAVIAGAKSCTITRQCQTKEKASSSNATETERVAGRSSWEVSLNHLLFSDTNTSPFEGILKVGQSVTLSMVIGSRRYYGTAICDHAEISGAVGGLATGQIHFLGSGGLNPG